MSLAKADEGAAIFYSTGIRPSNSSIRYILRHKIIVRKAWRQQPPKSAFNCTEVSELLF